MNGLKHFNNHHPNRITLWLHFLPNSMSHYCSLNWQPIHINVSTSLIMVSELKYGTCTRKCISCLFTQFHSLLFCLWSFCILQLSLMFTAFASAFQLPGFFIVFPYCDCAFSSIDAWGCFTIYKLVARFNCLFTQMIYCLFIAGEANVLFI